MLSLALVILLLLAFIVGLVTGAYSHKWLQRETGAPDNLNASTAAAAVKSLVDHGTNAAVAAVGDAHDAAVAAFKS